MPQETIFHLRRKELVEIFLLVLVVGFFVNITSQFIWNNFFTNFDFWTTTQIIIGFVSGSFLIYFFLYVVRGYKIVQIAEFYLVRRLEKKIPQESIIPEYKGLWYAQDALRRLGSKSKALNKKIIEQWGCLVDPICLDLMEYILLKWLAQKYHIGWLLGKQLSLKAYSSEKTLSKKSTTIKLDELPTELKQNNLFFKSLDEVNFRLILPPSTSFRRNTTQIQWNNPTRQIIFKNIFCSLEITFQNTWEQRMTSNIEPFLDSKEGKFQTQYFQIQIEAKFNRFLSITPWMDKYVKWVNDLANNLFDTFDWNVYVKKKIR